MRILIVHKFYQRNGGDSIYAIELEKYLKSKGHNVAFFAMNQQNSLDNSYKKFWPSEIDYSSPKIQNFLKLILRPFGTNEVINKFKSLINEFKPDIIHLNGIHSQLSPVINKISYSFNIPVIWTTHDYKIICTSQILLRDNKPCELCLTKPFSVIKYKCFKNSLFPSLLGYFENKVWDINKINKFTNYFIAPSDFLRKKLIKGGIDSNKISTINNFFDFSKISNLKEEKENYYCYFGRLSEIKGLDTLIEVSKELPAYNLKILGTGPLLNTFKEKTLNFDHIEILGYKNWDEMQSIVSKAKFSIIPSCWYENNPLSIIESFALGTPVLGASIGGIPELIKENETGLLFEARNKTDLKNKIKEMFEKNFNKDSIIKHAITKYNIETHYNKIMNIYKKFVS